MFNRNVLRLKSDGRGQRKIFRELTGDLIRGEDGALFGGDGGESLRELRVAVVLAGVGSGKKLLRGSELRGELRAIALVGAPGEEGGDTESKREAGDDEFWPKLGKHNWFRRQEVEDTLSVEILRRTLLVRLRMTSWR